MLTRKLISSLSLFIFSITILWGQTLTVQEQKYLNKKAIDIEVDGTYSNGNWKSVLKAIGDRRIVMLGEHNHGSNEVFMVRNDLIKTLHERLGFDVILFESGIGELIAIDRSGDEMTSHEMTYGFFGIWRNQAFRDLMTYIKENDIAISGVDVQRSGRTFDRVLKAQANEKQIRPALYDQIENRFSDISNRLSSNSKTAFDSIKGPTEQLILDYQSLLNEFDKHQSQGVDKVTLLTKRTLINRMEFLRLRLAFFGDKNWRQRFNDRDMAMAANVEWLLENIYKGKKVIVIGHDYHIAKFNAKGTVMGQLLMKNHESETYIMGIYGGEGTYHGNSGDLKSTDPIDLENLDIKHVIGQLDGKTHFINFDKTAGKRNQWLFNPLVVNDSFIDLNGSNKLVLTKHFDGVLLVDKISPPVR